MLPNIVDHLLHTDCLKLLGLSCPLVEDLRVQIIMVVNDVLFSLTQQHHNIDALLNLLGREMGFQHIDVKFVLAENSDMLVGSVVVRPERIHFIEDLRQVLLNFGLNRYPLLEQVQVIHLCPPLHISHTV